MTPAELIAVCTDAVERWNAGEMLAEAPFVMLVVPRATAPHGRTIRLFGRIGPKGDIAVVHDRKGHFDVVAYFPAVKVLEALGVRVRRAVRP